jgi:hypothetical protein
MTKTPTSSRPSSAPTWKNPADVGGAFARLRAAARAHVVRSDYCPECGRVGCCGGEHECADYRRRVARELERGLDRAFLLSQNRDQ